MLTGKIVRLRWVKPYQEAHNHVAIGEVLCETPCYLMLHCKTYHFGSAVGGGHARLVQNSFVGGIVEGEKAIRSVPWPRIEVINELPPGTEWDVEAHVDEAGLCVLANSHKTVVTRARGQQSV